jgi:thiol-disulfide isomerase/thioredoxin
MRKKRIIGILLVVAGVLAYLGQAIAFKLQDKKEIEAHVAVLQPFEFTGLLEENVPVKSKSTQAKVFFFFNTECEHCQAEARLVAKAYEALNKSDVYFLSIEPLEKIQKFAKDYGLAESPDINIGQIDAHEAAKFGMNSFPMVFIYAPDGELLKSHKGEVKIEAITKYIN